MSLYIELTEKLYKNGAISHNEWLQISRFALAELSSFFEMNAKIMQEESTLPDDKVLLDFKCDSVGLLNIGISARGILYSVKLNENAYIHIEAIIFFYAQGKVLATLDNRALQGVLYYDPIYCINGWDFKGWFPDEFGEFEDMYSYVQ